MKTLNYHKPLLLISGLALAVISSAKANINLPYSFLDQPVTKSIIPYAQQPKLLIGYFDIKIGAKLGESVVGKINLRDNRFAPTTNVAQQFQLRLTDGNDALKLVVKSDDLGRLYGELQVKDARSFLKASTISFSVALHKGDKLIEQQSSRVNVVTETSWQKIANNFKDYVKHHSRLSKRYKIIAKKLKAIIKELTTNKGKFNLDVYQLVQQTVVNKKEQKKISKQFKYINNTIGGLAYAYNNDALYAKGKNRAELKELIYLTIIEYVKVFPYQNFGSSAYFSHADITHQWRFTDAVLGGLSLMVDDLIKDIKQNNLLAIKAHKKLINMVEQVNFSLTSSYQDKSKVRYYMPNPSLLSQSNGVWSDANRHHRQRSWLAQAVISYDYNRPLTNNSYWFSDFEPFARNKASIFPDWQPEGSFFDIKTWLDSNLRLSHRYGQSGLLPDGSISHHVGTRQDMAHIAYGFEWLGNGITGASQVMANTPFAVNDSILNAQRSVLLTTYPKIIYRGGIDFQTVGRSHYGSNVASFGTELFSQVIDDNIAAPSSVPLLYQAEIKSLKSAIDQDEPLYSGSYAMWANDFVIHRNENKSAPYYMSVKMQSSRTKGAEGFAGSGPYGFHNGSGILQVKTRGKEYSDSRYGMDWHAMPGLTEEWRSDPLPLSSKKSMYNPNPFSGSLAGNNAAIASFHYDRLDPYAAAKARKTWLFNDNSVISLGNSVNRSKKGQGKNIITTIEQAHWSNTLSYQVNGKQGKWRVGSDVAAEFTSDLPMWFHQANTGYIVLPNNSLPSKALPTKTTKVIVRGGGSVNSSEDRNKVLKDFSATELAVYHLAIDHGTNPIDGDYCYITIANVAASEMPKLTNEYQNLTYVNEANAQAVYIKGKLLQVVFHQAGTVKINSELTISSDQPALFQLKNIEDYWQLAVSDPMHSTKLKEINFTINLPLPSGNYTYLTQGLEHKSVAGQNIVISTDNSISKIKVSLPDNSDDKAYQHRTALYAGMPAVTILK